jgi:BirA family biotin operon repressor/biotin-[acetyl-CoA-carboxylase] ligase
VPDLSAPPLGGRFGRPYLYRDVCESTQMLLESSLPEGAVAVCDEQTAGRGRLGRGWEAPSGAAVLCSVLLRPAAKHRPAELSLVGGMAAADAVERTLGLAVQIKWPNDVMVNRRKVAGVLAELRDAAVVLGIGINVNQTREQLPSDARTPAASLRTVDGVSRDRGPILALLLERLELQYELWQAGGIDAIYDSLGARDFLRGRKVAVDGVSGYAVGIDHEGRLEIDVDGRRRVVESGDVSYER